MNNFEASFLKIFKKYNKELKTSINSKILRNNFSCLKNPNYYTYILVNGSKLLSLLRNITNIDHRVLKGIFRKFLKCIFYVGKGTRNRKVTHLQNLQTLSIFGRKVNRMKARKILDVWRTGDAVTILNIGTSNR